MIEILPWQPDWPKAFAAGAAALKRYLAAAHDDDILASTRAKTAFVEGIMDGVHCWLGRARRDIRED